MKIRKLTTNQGGFTLIELLVVIGILAILLAITLIALNPTQHFQGARNAQRQSDVSAVLDGIYEYEAGHTGTMPPSVNSLPVGVVQVAKIPSASASGTSFSTPNLTFTVPAGNLITGAVGTVTVSGCSQAGDNGTFNLVSGTSTTIVLNDVGGSATSATGCSLTAWTGAADICSDLVPSYVADLPSDPTSGTRAPGLSTNCASATAYYTGYTITKASGRFTVTAPSAENGASISVTR